MNRYIGVKEINGEPMTLGEYNILRGWEIPSDEDPASEGFLVEYLDGGKPNHPDYSNYISWSPKDIFDRAYHKTIGMNFGLAIEAMKRGAKVARGGWNGKDMWITYNGGHENLDADEFWNTNNSDFAYDNGGSAEVTPFISMKTADGKIQMGWLASQTDMLAEDWRVV